MKRNFFVICLIACLLFTACGYGEVKIETATDDTAQKIYVTPTAAPLPGTTGQISTSLPVCGQESIMILISSYYAAMETGTVDELGTLVSNPERIDEKQFDKFENASDVNVIRVYALEGTGSIETIAYVYYEVFIEGIETSVPSLDELFIKNDNGTYYIYNGTLPTNEYDQLVKLTSVEGVSELVTSVNREFMNKMNSDEALKEYIDGLN